MRSAFLIPNNSAGPPARVRPAAFQRWRIGGIIALILALFSPARAAAIILSNDFGDAPPPYPTLANNRGAYHTILQGFYLGQTVDGETDGQPNALATGDDNNPVGIPDDEDGVLFLTDPLPQGGTASVRVTASQAGRLDAWVDFNADGDWDDSGEHIFTSLLLTAGANILTFPVPSTANQGQTFARFRLSQEGNLTPIDYGGAGEVEDYRVNIGSPIDFDFGDAPQVYPTLLSQNGARHQILKGFYLGNLVDTEADGQPSPLADGDDLNPPHASNDEDGVRFLTPLVPGNTVDVEVTASQDGRLDAWVDFNGNGSWADAGEQIFASESLVAGVNVLFFVIPLDLNPTANAFARFRLSREGKLSYLGSAPDGEVEDYQLTIAEPQDYGDAPDSYRTLLASDGPRHRSGQTFHLGAYIDYETDGQPNATATGDDDNPSGTAPDDEDGVVFEYAPGARGQRHDRRNRQHLRQFGCLGGFWWRRIVCGRRRSNFRSGTFGHRSQHAELPGSQ